MFFRNMILGEGDPPRLRGPTIKTSTLESETLNTFTYYLACQVEKLCVMGTDNNTLEGQKKGWKGISAFMCACRVTNKGRHVICLNNEQQGLALCGCLK